MRVGELEQAIFELEEVRVVFRAPRTDEVGDYLYVRKAADNTSVTEWLEQRVVPIARGIAVVVVDGNGRSPHGRAKMATVRASYSV